MPGSLHFEAPTALQYFATLVAECEDDLPLLLVEIYQYFRARPAGGGKPKRNAPAVAKVKAGAKKLH